MNPSPGGGRLSSLKSSLSLLVLLSLAPSVAVAGFLAAEDWRLHRERTYERTAMAARALMADLDRQLAAVESGLRVLATSPDLARGDLAAFHRSARAAVAGQLIYNYILTEPGGRMVLNTLVPWGEPLPGSGTPKALEAVFATGRPVLTDWFIGPVTHRPALAMGVPVTVAGKVRYSLNIGLTPETIGAILGQAVLPDQWVASVLDGGGTILARTRDGAQFSGKQAVAEVRRELGLRREGSLEARTVEGIPVVTSFSRSAAWSWSVAVGAPRSVLEAELVRLLTWSAAGTAAALVFGLIAAGSIARRVTASIRGLNDAALALGSGKPLQLPSVQWKEAAAVGQALVQASELLVKEHHRATHDPLTGLANRALFDELLRHEFASAARSGACLAVVCLDLDGFKAVNDTFGHAAGDLVLAEASHRIRSALRSADTAARLGGDEFSVLLAGCDRDEALVVAGRLVEALAEPYPGVGPGVSSSAGVAVYPLAGPTLRHLVESADRALYRAKESGKRRVATEP